MGTLSVGGRVEEGSKAWYREILLLPDSGAVPGVPGRGVKSSKGDCVAAFGAATSAGRYKFRGRGSPQYESYTLELLERTQQEDVENVTSLPYHFARGLLDEENGDPVNWTLFALRRQRAHARRKSTSEYLLPKYRGADLPIPFVHPRVPVGRRIAPTEAKNTPPVSTLALRALLPTPVFTCGIQNSLGLLVR